MKVFDRILSFIEVYFTIALLIIMTIVALLQVLLRFTGFPLFWTEESARYIFVWLIYLGCSKAVRDNEHMSVDLLPIILKERGKLILSIITNLLCMVFFIYLAVYGAGVLQSLVNRVQLSPAMQINMLIPYTAPVVGMVMMLLRSVYNIILTIQKLAQHGGEAV